MKSKLYLWLGCLFLLTACGGQEAPPATKATATKAATAEVTTTVPAALPLPTTTAVSPTTTPLPTATLAPTNSPSPSSSATLPYNSPFLSFTYPADWFVDEDDGFIYATTNEGLIDDVPDSLANGAMIVFFPHLISPAPADATLLESLHLQVKEFGFSEQLELVEEQPDIEINGQRAAALRYHGTSDADLPYQLTFTIVIGRDEQAILMIDGTATELIDTYHPQLTTLINSLTLKSITELPSTDAYQRIDILVDDYLLSTNYPANDWQLFTDNDAVFMTSNPFLDRVDPENVGNHIGVLISADSFDGADPTTVIEEFIAEQSDTIIIQEIQPLTIDGIPGATTQIRVTQDDLTLEFVLTILSDEQYSFLIAVISSPLRTDDLPLIQEAVINQLQFFTENSLNFIEEFATVEDAKLLTLAEDGGAAVGLRGMPNSVANIEFTSPTNGLDLIVSIFDNNDLVATYYLTDTSTIEDFPFAKEQYLLLIRDLNGTAADVEVTISVEE